MDDTQGLNPLDNTYPIQTYTLSHLKDEIQLIFNVPRPKMRLYTTTINNEIAELKDDAKVISWELGTFHLSNIS